MKALQPTVRYRERLAALEASNVAKQVLQLLTVEKERPSFSLRLTENVRAVRHWWAFHHVAAGSHR